MKFPNNTYTKRRIESEKTASAVATTDRKRPLTSFLTFFLLFMLMVFAVSCEYEHYQVPPPPKTVKETEVLEASYTTDAPVTLNSKFWKNADYKKITASDLSAQKLYAEGMLNMTGTYNGKTNFNGGKSPEIIMKAGYDEQKLYILVEWLDSDYSPALTASIWNGATDPLKTDTTAEWTSQGNSDKLALAFDISNTSNSAGTFSAAGCAATCHTNNNTTMKPISGKADLWSWDLAISEPLGYARDMVIDAINGISDDAGQKMIAPNKTDSGNTRSAPAYEWNGIEQTVTRPDGKETKLDPAFYLLNKTPFTGNPSIGYYNYHNSVYGCNHCHGEEGEGGDGSAFNVPGFNRLYSHQGVKDFASGSGHTGQSYFAQVPADSIDHLIAFIKGLGGIPGNYLTTPGGSNADIWAISNVIRSKVDIIKENAKYQVLLVRNLITGNADDVQFSAPAGKEFTFGIALMDADGKNHIGSNKEILKFMNKE